MKITHVIDTIETGGKLRVLLELVDGLRKRGVPSTVVCFEDRVPAAARLADENIPLRVVGFRGASARFRPGKLGLIRAIRDLSRILEADRADLVHGHLHVLDPLLYTPGLAGPTMSTVHGFHPDWGQAGRPGRLVRTWCERIGVRRRGFRFVAVSSRVAEGLSAALRLPRATIRVIPNGIDLDQWSLTPSPPIDHSAPRITMVGRLAPEKNLTTAVEALGLLVRDYPDAKLTLAGEGPERARLESLVGEMRLSARVTFLGEIDTVRDRLAASTLVWITSTSEGLPVVALEAMAARVPVVTTAWPGVEELLRDGETARVVPLGDAESLARASADLLRNPSSRQDLITRAHELVCARYGKEKFVDAYLEAYRDAIEDSW